MNGRVYFWKQSVFPAGSIQVFRMESFAAVPGGGGGDFPRPSKIKSLELFGEGIFSHREPDPAEAGFFLSSRRMEIYSAESAPDMAAKRPVAVATAASLCPFIPALLGNIIYQT